VLFFAKGPGANSCSRLRTGEKQVNDENLEKGLTTRFKTGQSGNPGGRPRKRPISDRLREMAEVLLPEEKRIKFGLPEGATYGDGLAEKLYDSALAGKTDAIREIRDAIEGKAGPRVEGPDFRDQPTEFAVYYAASILPANTPNVSPVAVSLPPTAKSN
jgi:Family of unknown function (DUF5681)